MLRTTITPENTDVHISVPQRFVGKKVEVLLYTTDEEEPLVTTPKNSMAKFWGVLSDETAADLHKTATESRNEWDRDI